MTDFIDHEGSSMNKIPHIDQMFDPGKGYNPVSELMRAMVLRVIEDIKSGGELRSDAMNYLFDDSDEDEYILSFKGICNYMGFDPKKTREQIVHALLHEGRRISTRRRAA